MKAFLDELKRRNVIRVGGIYLVAGWILMQAAALLEGALSLPDWFDTIIVSLILLGFPVVLLFSWIFEVTPEGLRRTPATDTPEDQAFAASTRRRLDLTLIAVIVLAVAVVAVDRLLPGDTPPASAAATEGAAATSVTSQATAPPKSQRVAFFGFTASGNDPVLSGIAEMATNEVFQALSAQQVELAARADTLGPQLKTRIDRSAELGARFALSGEVRLEVGSGRVSVSTRLEDVATRATLWEETFADEATAPLAVAVKAAASATGVASCMVGYYFSLALSSADNDLLVAVAALCASRNTFGPEAIRALRKLVRLAPKDGNLHARLAVNLIATLDAVTPLARPAQLAEAEQAMARADALDPHGFLVAWGRYRLGVAHGKPMVDLETVLKTSLQRRPDGGGDIFAHAQVNGAYGSFLGLVGRTRSSLPYLRTATEEDPFNVYWRFYYALALAAEHNPEAGEIFQQAFARQPMPSYGEWWIGSAVLLGAGDANQLLASPPKVIPEAVVRCWREIQAAVKSGNLKAGAKGVSSTKACFNADSLTSGSAVAVLANLGDLDGAFAVAADRPAFTVTLGTIGARSLFWSSTRAMRADPRFLPLVEKLGLMEYWRAAKSQPDVCETEDVPFCRELKKAAKP